MLSSTLPSDRGWSSACPTKENSAGAANSSSAEPSTSPRPILANYHICFTGYREEDELFAAFQEGEGRGSTFCRSSTNASTSAAALPVSLNWPCPSKPYEERSARSKPSASLYVADKATKEARDAQETQEMFIPPPTLDAAVAEEGMGQTREFHAPRPVLRGLADYKLLAESLGARVANNLSRRGAYSSSLLLVAWRGLTRKRLIAERLHIPVVMPCWLELHHTIPTAGENVCEVSNGKIKQPTPSAALETSMFAVPWLYGYVFSTSRMIVEEEETLKLLVQRHGGVLQPFLNQRCDALLVSTECANLLRKFLHRRVAMADLNPLHPKEVERASQKPALEKNRGHLRCPADANAEEVERCGVSRKILVAWRCDIPVLDYARFLTLAGLREEQTGAAGKMSSAHLGVRLDFDTIAETCRIGPPATEQLLEVPRSLTGDDATTEGHGDKKAENGMERPPNESEERALRPSDDSDEDGSRESLTSYASSFHDAEEMGDAFFHPFKEQDMAVQTIEVHAPDYYSPHTFRDGGAERPFSREEPAPSGKILVLGLEKEEGVKSTSISTSLPVDMVGSYYAKRNAERNTIQSGLATSDDVLEDAQRGQFSGSAALGAAGEAVAAAPPKVLASLPLLPIRQPFLTICLLGCSAVEESDGVGMAVACRFLRLPCPTSGVDVVIFGSQILRKRKLVTSRSRNDGPASTRREDFNEEGSDSTLDATRPHKRPSPVPLRDGGKKKHAPCDPKQRSVVFYTASKEVVRALEESYGIPSHRLVSFAWLRDCYQRVCQLDNEPQKDVHEPSSVPCGVTNEKEEGKACEKVQSIFVPGPLLAVEQLPNMEDRRYRVHAWSRPAGTTTTRSTEPASTATAVNKEVITLDEIPKERPPKPPPTVKVNPSKNAKAAPPWGRPVTNLQRPVMIPPVTTTGIDLKEDQYRTELERARNMMNALLRILSSTSLEQQDAQPSPTKQPTELFKGVVLCFAEGDFARLYLAVVRGLVNFGSGTWVKKTALEWRRVLVGEITQDSKRGLNASNDSEAANIPGEVQSEGKHGKMLWKEADSNRAPTADMLEAAVRKNIVFGKLKKLLLYDPLASFDLKPSPGKSAQRARKGTMGEEKLSTTMVWPQTCEPVSSSGPHVRDESCSITESSMVSNLEESQSIASPTSQGNRRAREPHSRESGRSFDRLRTAAARCRSRLALRVIPHFYQQPDNGKPTPEQKHAPSRPNAGGESPKEVPSPLRYLPPVTSDYLLCCLASQRLLDPKSCFIFHRPIPRSPDALLLRHAQLNAKGEGKSTQVKTRGVGSTVGAVPELSPWVWKRRYAKQGSVGVCLFFLWILPENASHGPLEGSLDAYEKEKEKEEEEEVLGKQTTPNKSACSPADEIAPLLRSLVYGLCQVVRALGGAVWEEYDPNAVTHVVAVDVAAILSSKLDSLYGVAGQRSCLSARPIMCWPPCTLETALLNATANEVSLVSLRWLEESMQWGFFVDERAAPYVWTPPITLLPFQQTEKKRVAKESMRSPRLSPWADRSTSPCLVQGAGQALHARIEPEQPQEPQQHAEELLLQQLSGAFNFRTPVATPRAGAGAPSNSPAREGAHWRTLRQTPSLSSPIRPLNPLLTSATHRHRRMLSNEAVKSPDAMTKTASLPGQACTPVKDPFPTLAHPEPPLLAVGNATLQLGAIDPKAAVWQSKNVVEAQHSMASGDAFEQLATPIQAVAPNSSEPAVVQLLQCETDPSLCATATVDTDASPGVGVKRPRLHSSHPSPPRPRKEFVIGISSSSDTEGEFLEAKAANATDEALAEPQPNQSAGKEAAPSAAEEAKTLKVYVLHDLPGRAALLGRFEAAMRNLLPLLPPAAVARGSFQGREASVARASESGPVVFVEDYRYADCLVTHELSLRESVLAAMAAGLWVVQPGFVEHVVGRLEQQRRGEAAAMRSALERFAWAPETLPWRAPPICHALARQCVWHRQRRQAGQSRVFDRKLFVLCFLEDDKAVMGDGKGHREGAKTDEAGVSKSPCPASDEHANTVSLAGTADLLTKRQQLEQPPCDWKKKVAPIARLVRAGGGELLCTARVQLNSNETVSGVYNCEGGTPNPHERSCAPPPLELAALEFSASPRVKWFHHKAGKKQGGSNLDPLQNVNDYMILNTFSTLLCAGAMACCCHYPVSTSTRTDGHTTDFFDLAHGDGNVCPWSCPSPAREPSVGSLAAPELVLLIDTTLLNRKLPFGAALRNLEKGTGDVGTASSLAPCTTLRDWWWRLFNRTENAEYFTKLHTALQRILQTIQKQCRACLQAGDVSAGGSCEDTRRGIPNPSKEGPMKMLNFGLSNSNNAPSNFYDDLTLDSARFLATANPSEALVQKSHAEEASVEDAVVYTFVQRVRQDAEAWTAELFSERRAAKGEDRLGGDRVERDVIRQLASMRLFSVKSMSWLAREVVGQKDLNQDPASCIGAMTLD